MNIRIEAIKESDFEDLLSLFSEFATFEKLEDSMTNSVEQMREEKEYLKGFVARTDENKIVGYATYFYTYYTWSGKAMYMDDLYICKEHQGIGIGTRLINEIITYAKQTKCNRLRWQVSDWNEPAIKFYKNLGAAINPTERNCDLIF